MRKIGVDHNTSAQECNKTPILSGSIPAFEMFMTAWEQLSTKNPYLRCWTSVGVKWAVEYYEHMDNTSTYILSMGV